MTKARQLADLGNAYDDGALSNRNLIINGAMQVAQRGTSVTIANTGAYSSPDRFRVQHNANTTSTLTQVSDAPSNFKYSLKFTNGAGETRDGADYARLYTRLEGYDVNHLKLGTSSAKGFTLQFWVKSSLTGTFGVGFTGNDNGSNGVYSSSYTISSANTWEYKTVTVPATTITSGTWTGTSGVGISIHWDLGEGINRSETAGWHPSESGGHMGLTGGVKLVETTGATFQITGVQLEVGDTATPFEHGKSYGEELAKCQRYYANYKATTGQSHMAFPYSGFANSTTAELFGNHPAEMRVPPTVSFNSVSAFRIAQSASDQNTTGMTVDFISTSSMRLRPTVSTGLTAGQGVGLLNRPSTLAIINFDAEL